MRIRYVKRVRMSLELSELCPRAPELPVGLTMLSWRDSLVDVHARVLHAAFCNDLDGRFFPTFRQYEACKGLVEATVGSTRWFRQGWFLVADAIASGRDGKPARCYGAVHTTKTDRRIGEIQNISVMPGARRQGLGRALLASALFAFRSCNFRRVNLDVTAENYGAMRLYLAAGFRQVGISFTESFVDDSSQFIFQDDDRAPKDYIEFVT